MATIDVKKALVRPSSIKGGGVLTSSAGGMKIRTRIKSQVSLIIGGGRSGKSTYAQDYALGVADQRESRAYIATAEPVDEEMERRIAVHQADRDDRFITIEEPIDLAGALRNLPPSVEVCVVDCLTVWLGNLLYHRGVSNSSYAELDEFYEAVHTARCDLLLVTNETGLGIIPADAESRAFRDLAGRMNQRVASLSQNVVLIVAGLPLALKGVVL